jgi:hypothetical protein
VNSSPELSEAKMAVVVNVVRAGDTGKTNPYTIAVIANPALEAPWRSGAFVKDPILASLASFQAAVVYIEANLFATLPGQKERLLADPAIQPKVRLVSVFDDTLAPGPTTSLAGQDGVSNILVARRNAFAPLLTKYSIIADVAYAVSASPTHTRASAWFTTDDDSGTGIPFTLDGASFVHRYNCVVPGTVGIHFTASSLTALHEFGHAASSYTNGSVLDLYVDSPPGLNNKVGRPIPPNFAVYQGNTFKSDPARDGLGYPAGWGSFHCELLNPGCPAVMDNYYLSPSGALACQHDAVTERFLRDRVLAKIGRP